MTIKIKLPQKKDKKYIEFFFKKKGLAFLVEASKKKNRSVNQMNIPQPYKPELTDLYNLYQFIILNKRTTVLEFGSGWSSLVFYLALRELKSKFYANAKKLRRNNLFELFILENERKYLNISKKRINKFQKNFRNKNPNKVHYLFSEVEMTLFNNKFSTHYRKLPMCNPDFIYLDGPDQFNIKKDINGISTRHRDMMPMSCDILKFEHFYTPGTIIVCDGRAANAKFLKDNFQRNWKYYNDKKNDQHIFCLNDPILGKFNKLQLDFYNN
tara:strand:- start:452 stop:1258 length:807 start_codon:yes stop_codon:yes gene_type:complete